MGIRFSTIPSGLHTIAEEGGGVFDRIVIADWVTGGGGGKFRLGKRKWSASPPDCALVLADLTKCSYGTKEVHCSERGAVFRGKKA